MHPPDHYISKNGGFFGYTQASINNSDQLQPKRHRHIAGINGRHSVESGSHETLYEADSHKIALV
jgi:hypothetical protein